MNREEMLKRLKAGEDPLDLSIEKWKDIVDCLNQIQQVEEFGEELEAGRDNCALCEVYRNCHLCPVSEWTHKKGCVGTPYDDFKLVRRVGDLKTMRIAAEQELEFLISLKKELNKEG